VVTPRGSSRQLEASKDSIHPRRHMRRSETLPFPICSLQMFFSSFEKPKQVHSIYIPGTHCSPEYCVAVSSNSSNQFVSLAKRGVTGGTACMLQSCWLTGQCHRGSVLQFMKSHLLMYSNIKVWNGIQATPQGRRLLRTRVGFEPAIKRLPA
jgi:hypothetical protein